MKGPKRRLGLAALALGAAAAGAVITAVIRARTGQRKASVLNRGPAQFLEPNGAELGLRIELKNAGWDLADFEFTPDSQMVSGQIHLSANAVLNVELVGTGYVLNYFEGVSGKHDFAGEDRSAGLTRAEVLSLLDEIGLVL